MNKEKITVHPDFGGINARPGKAQNMTIEAVRKFITNQKKSTGFRFALSTGTNEDLEINLPGNAKMFMGLAVIGSADVLSGGLLKFQINNEIILDNVSLRFLSYEFTDESYYFYPRPLSGQDDISISIKEANAGTLDVKAVYL